MPAPPLPLIMPSTYLSLHYHLVFSTKDRAPLIRAAIITRLHEYLGGTINGLGGNSQGVGGVADHVHLLIGLPATLRLADVMRELKKASSSWMRTEGGDRAFSWQQGYAAFTVSATSREGVQRYIANQQEHHRTVPFRDELVAMLAKAGVNYDERDFE